MQVHQAFFRYCINDSRISHVLPDQDQDCASFLLEQCNDSTLQYQRGDGYRLIIISIHTEAMTS
jgi:hypothetical protein